MILNFFVLALGTWQKQMNGNRVSTLNCEIYDSFVRGFGVRVVL